MGKFLFIIFGFSLLSTSLFSQTRDLNDLLMAKLKQGDRKSIKIKMESAKVKTMTKWNYEVRYGVVDSIAKKSTFSQFDQHGNRIEEMLYTESGDMSDHWHMEYDNLGRIVVTVCKDEQLQSVPFKIKQIFLYDNVGNVQITEYRNGNTVDLNRQKTFKCDKFGDLIEEDDFKWTVKFNGKGLVVDSTGIEERTRAHRWTKVTITFRYDDYGKIIESTKQTFDDISDIPALTTVSVYDSNRFIVEVREYLQYSNKLAKTTTFKYAMDGMLIELRSFSSSNEPIEFLKFDYTYY